MKPKRELSEAQFQAQLAKAGWKQVMFGLWFVDTTGQFSEGLNFGAVLHPKTFKIMRRATLAKLARERKGSKYLKDRQQHRREPTDAERIELGVPALTKGPA